MARTRTEGLKEYRRKLILGFPKAAKEMMHEANSASADDFMAVVRRNMKVGDPERGHVIDTLTKRDGDPEFGGVGVLVSIGDAARPYPFHLEAGHKTADGSHVPAQPVWNPAKREVAKRHTERAAKALDKAVRRTTRGF